MTHGGTNERKRIMGQYFKGLKDAAVFDRGVPLNRNGKLGDEHNYVLEVQKALIKDTMKGLATIVEFTVVESDSPDDPVGAKRTWFQKMTNKQVAFGAIKEFLYALNGVDRHADPEAAKKLDLEMESIMDAVESDSEALKGERIGVNTLVIMTQKEPRHEFTRLNWKGAPQT